MIVDRDKKYESVKKYLTLDRMETSSAWIEEVKPLRAYGALLTNLDFEVCVVGGGITGVTAAYYLAKAGKKVVLLEKDSIAHGESGYTTAFISHVIDADLQELKKTFGSIKARYVWKSCQETLDEIERIIREEQIECEFSRCPLFMYANSESDMNFLEEEGALARRLGFAFELHPPDTRFIHGHAVVPSQAKFHPEKYITALAEKAVEYGAVIFENTRVTGFKGREKNIVTTTGGNITAHEVIEATHSPIGSPLFTATRLQASQTYVLETKIARGVFTEGIYIDTENPYHYFRIDPKGEYDRLILGGEDHETGEEIDQAERFTRLEEYLHTLFPHEELPIVRYWSGQVFATPDGIPFIGRLSKNSHHLVGTGYGGDGMSFGSLAAKIMTDVVLEKKNPWIDLYTPLRLRENATLLQMGAKYVKEMITGRTKLRDHTIGDIAPGSGKVLTIHGKKVAVSKDKDGKIEMVSAVCTHLGCVVNFNNDEGTWDCPCHGSRFEKGGAVLSGPAKRPLDPIKS